MTTTISPLDLNNVQGDILAGLVKKTETYVFFQIDNARVTEFRKSLNALIPLITSTAQTLSHKSMVKQIKTSSAQHKLTTPILKLSAVNILFSSRGLVKIGLKDEIGDAAFDAGMLADAANLGDKGSGTVPNFKPDWVPAFTSGTIDGVLLISGDCHATVSEEVKKIEAIFAAGTHNASIHEVLRIVGDVRPGAEKGHEHFGFLDGISNPAIEGVDTKPNPGQETIPQGMVLLGRTGDAPTLNGKAVTRPSWALDGSFAALRYLFQLVPEFDQFLKANPIPGMPAAEGSELLGARMVGRWKSGAPIDLAPTKDDPALGADPLRNNDFKYDLKNPDDFSTQTRCPFAAHTRKTNPRNDLEQPFGATATQNRRIVRRGIPFGSEVSPAETAAKKTIHARGLLFVGYQSNIENSFQFIQHSWANTLNFPPKTDSTGNAIISGFDPIIGQQNSGGPRATLGLEPQAQAANTQLPTEWVVSKGGEYLFAPSIPALKSVFALKLVSKSSSKSWSQSSSSSSISSSSESSSLSSSSASASGSVREEAQERAQSRGRLQKAKQKRMVRVWEDCADGVVPVVSGSDGRLGRGRGHGHGLGSGSGVGVGMGMRMERRCKVSSRTRARSGTRTRSKRCSVGELVRREVERVERWLLKHPAQ